MNDVRHEEVKGLVAAYVLGAVPLEEVAAVRAHILSCDECLGVADELAEVASALAMSVDAAPLAPDFTEKVLSAARGEEPATAPTPQALRPAPRRRWSLLPKLAMLTVTLLVATLATTLVQTRQKVDRLQETLVQTRQKVDRQQEALAFILRSNEGIDLEGPRGAVATVVPTDSGSFFVAYGLETAPPRRTYQLWLMKGGKPVSAGTFEVDDGLATFETSTPLEGYEGAAVTIEPEGGSPRPTGRAVVTSA